VRDRSRTAVVEQLARAPALLDPERLASGAGSLLRHGVYYAGQLASISLAARRFNPKKATGASPIPPSPTTPSTTASCRPTSPCAPRGHHGSRSPPARKDKELLQFCQHGDVIIAGAYQCAARQSGRAQTRLRKRRCEPGARPGAITCIDVRFNGGMLSQVKQGALCVREDLAVTSGAVVYRDALCEVIQSVVAY
jgi:polyhydroxyalkanoate synthase subunit PhaC